MILFSVKELRLASGHQTLLDGVALAIAAGGKVGLVGRHGCGKSSSSRSSRVKTNPTPGTSRPEGVLRIGYLPQGFELDSELSIYDSILAEADDATSAITRYKNGEGSEAGLAVMACQEKLSTPEVQTDHEQIPVVTAELVEAK